MLEELEVRNLGPIHTAKLSLHRGMTAITGETGAGKSMLLSAVRLISGGPVSAARVTPGADAAWAQGIFDVDESGSAAELAKDAGALNDDGAESDPDPDEVGRRELFLARMAPASGRSRAVLDGHSIPRAVLKGITDELVTIHGQSDQLRMAAPPRQREFLDMVAGDNAQLKAYGESWNELVSMDDKLSHILSQEASERQRADYLRDSVEQINKIDPQPGEDDELRERRARIEHASEITHGVGSALSALDTSQIDTDSDASGATDAITHAIQALRTIHTGGAFDEAADRLESINADLTDVVYSLSGQINEEEDSESLDSINARIHDLDELTRRWGPDLKDVIAWRDKAVFEIEDLDASPQKVDELKEKRSRLYTAAVEKAEDLSAARLKAAQELSATVTEELGNLAMAGASLRIDVSRRMDADGGEAASGHDGTGLHGHGVLDAFGMDDIEFLFTPFPGSPQLPMGKSASGGELSRLMLALELSAAQKRTDTTDMTFIFDEVDAGVGGKAAVELGRRLARLAQTSQVLVVTHLPQVASWADAQFVVSKGTAGAAENSVGRSPTGPGSEAEDSAVFTSVSKVEGDDRVREIARMLSGDETEASLEHARELLAASVL